MQTEVEAKFRAESAAPLDELATRTALGAATLGPPRRVTEVDRYLDTDDHLLDAARWACRLRRRNDATRISLKGPPIGAGAAWQHRRPEVEGPASDEIDPESWPASPARELLRSLSGGRPLRERLRLDQDRTEREVLVDGSHVATLSLDRVRMSSDGVDLGGLLVVELELDRRSSRAEDDLAGLGAALASVPGLVPDPRTKLEHALERLGRRG